MDLALYVLVVTLFAASLFAQATAPDLAEFERRTDVRSERKSYADTTGLFRANGEVRMNVLEHPWADAGEKRRYRIGASSTLVGKVVGMFGFYAGPDLHIGKV